MGALKLAGYPDRHVDFIEKARVANHDDTNGLTNEEFWFILSTEARYFVLEECGKPVIGLGVRVDGEDALLACLYHDGDPRSLLRHCTEIGKRILMSTAHTGVKRFSVDVLSEHPRRSSLMRLYSRYFGFKPSLIRMTVDVETVRAACLA